MISTAAKKEIDQWIKKYPEDWKSSAVMQALKIVQKENNNFLTEELINDVALYLDMPPIAVAEVATFYENFNHKPVGKHVIRFCHTISCMLNGADDLIKYTEKKIGAKVGDVSKDGLVSIKKVECLGACRHAPMFQIDDKYYEDLTKEKIDLILEDLK